MIIIINTIWKKYYLSLLIQKNHIAKEPRLSKVISTVIGNKEEIDK